MIKKQSTLNVVGKHKIYSVTIFLPQSTQSFFAEFTKIKLCLQFKHTKLCVPSLRDVFLLNLAYLKTLRSMW
jgi:hypothetical protein